MLHIPARFCLSLAAAVLVCGCASGQLTVPVAPQGPVSPRQALGQAKPALLPQEPAVAVSQLTAVFAGMEAKREGEPLPAEVKILGSVLSVDTSVRSLLADAEMLAGNGLGGYDATQLLSDGGGRLIGDGGGA